MCVCVCVRYDHDPKWDHMKKCPRGVREESFAESIREREVSLAFHTSNSNHKETHTTKNGMKERERERVSRGREKELVRKKE